ncbi:MAG TPA: hypothetical protein PLL23_15060 [Chitinophagaceae bacterium]|nr:hypothetical protein [Chitinophagaceae bacterium]
MLNLPNPVRSNFVLPALAALFLMTTLFSSCADDAKAPLASDAPEKKEFKMNCVKLTRAQMQAWVDSGWTRPGTAGKINTLLLQFYSADAAGIASNMQLTSYPGSSATDFKTSGNALLAVDTACKAKTFSGKVILANNQISFDALKVFNADGSLKEFDYIRFTPQSFSQISEYITFNAEVIKSDGGIESDLGGPTKPCPPVCCPPLCE